MKRNVVKLYLVNALSNSGFHLVVYTLFMQSKGLSMQEILVSVSSTRIVSLLAEVPTGIFADRIGRKWSLILYGVIRIASTLLLTVSGSFVLVLTACAVGGIADAFLSGANTAMLYDTLKATGDERRFHQLLGRAMWYSALATAAGGIGGGILASRSLSYPFWATLAALVPALMVAITLKEPPVSSPLGYRDSYLLHLTESLKHAFSNQSGYFVLYATLVSSFIGVGFMLWQPYLELTGMPLGYFGAFYAVEALLCGIVSRQSSRIEARIGVSASIILVPLLLASSLLLESQFQFSLGFIFIFLQSMSESYMKPTMETYINARIPSSRRATVLSFKNMLGSLNYAILAPLVGWAVDVYSLQTALLQMAAAVFLLGTVLVLVHRMRYKEDALGST